MSSRRPRRVVIGACATAAVLAAGSGLAYAYFTSTGSAAGSGVTGTSVSLSVSAPAVAGLYPGRTVAATVTVQNPNAFPVVLTEIDFAPSTTAAAGCDAAAVTGADRTGLSQTIAANGTTTVTVQVSMATSAASACQGASFGLTATAKGTSS